MAEINSSTTETEVWKPVVGYEGIYEVSSHGRVRRIGKAKAAQVGRISVRKPAPHGYIPFLLCVNNVHRTCYVHQLVAEAFIGKRPPGHEVNHIDGNKANNRAENLEYVTPSENHFHASRAGLKPRGEQHVNAKLTEAKVREIRRLLAEGLIVRVIAKRLCVSVPSVNHVKYGTHWRHVI